MMLNTNEKITGNNSIIGREDNIYIDAELLQRCRGSILEYAYRSLELTYLSDIKQPYNMIRFLDLILEENVKKAFDSQEYQRAVSYVVGKTVQGNSHEENIALLQSLRKVFLFDMKQRESWS